MKASELFKGIASTIGAIILVPLAVAYMMLVMILFAWPLFCAALIVVFCAAFLSPALAWVLFWLLMLFVLLTTIAKATL